MSSSPSPSSQRSPSPSLPPPPSSAKLPPRPSSSTTSHVPYARQSLGPGGPQSASTYSSLSSANSSATNNANSSTGPAYRNFSGPAGAVRSGGVGGRPSSEILGGGHLGGIGNPGGNAEPRNAEAEAIDRWFQDLASYEVTLEEMAAASLDQNFTEELSAIEQWFRVLSEAERTAALYSLLQHSTQLQIRFFMTVLQQMARSDPMSVLLSPAVGTGMQAQVEAKMNSYRSPVRTSFGGGNATSAVRESFADNSAYLTPESALSTLDGPPLGAAAATTGSQRKSSASSAHKPNRISAPGGLNSLTPSWLAGGSTGLDQVLERGPSPGGESVTSTRSTDRPKSADFSGLANIVPGSTHPAGNQKSRSSSRMSMPGSGAGLGLGPPVGATSNMADEISFPSSPSAKAGGSFPMSPNSNAGGWASMSSTPTGQVPKLSDAPKRRVTGGGNPTGSGYPSRSLFNDESAQQQYSQQQQPGGVGSGVGLGVGINLKSGRNFSSPGNVGGSFQGPATGAWAQSRQSPALGSTADGFGPSGLNNLTNGLSSPSPSDLAFQMSQLQLQQLQIQQLQQLQQLGAAAAGGNAGATTGAGTGSAITGLGGLGGIGIGLPVGGLQNPGMGLGLGAFAGLNNAGLIGLLGQQQAQLQAQVQAQAQAQAQVQAQGQQTPRSVSIKSHHNGSHSGTRRSPMLGVSGSAGLKSPSPGGSGRRESGGSGWGAHAQAGQGQAGEEDVDIRVLEDVPQWLRTLRLHKYTPNFENSKWTDMVVMSDADLEAQGVAALGARRKLLKTFEAVRAQMGIPEPESSGAGAEADAGDEKFGKEGKAGKGGDEELEDEDA